MSALQWALLLLGVGIVVALIWSSRRDKRALERLGMPSPPASRDWSVRHDALPESSPAAPSRVAETDFDEYGVSRPRRKVAPEISGFAPAPGTAARPPEKLIGFYIAEHEGTNILGPKIHAALRERGLSHGARRIYHRANGDQTLFSVASLVKPGVLDPADAEGFATPGLSVFMILPGPADPVAAFHEMLDTARGLARALNAELYDSEQRAPLTPEHERTLQRQVEEWVRQHGAAARPGA